MVSALRFACAVLASLALAQPVVARAWQLAAAITPTSAAASTPTAANGAPTAIDVADIPSLADVDQRLAERALEANAEPGAPAASFARRLARIEAAVEDPFWRITFAEMRMLPIPRLESLSRHWRFQARQLARWQSDLAIATTHRASDAAGLASRREAWVTTATSGQELPIALRQRVDEVVVDLAQAEAGLSDPLARLIALGRRGNAVDARIESAQRRVAEAIAAYDTRLLRVDGPPLWQLTPASVVSVADTSDTVRNGLEIESRFAEEYVKGDAMVGRRALQTLLSCSLPLLLWLAWRSRGPIKAGQISRTEASVLSRPLSCWLLLVVIGAFAFQPDAPMLTHQLALVIAVVPVMRLLPTSHRRLLGITPHVASALFLLLRLGFVFLSSPVPYRLYIFSLTLLGLAAAGWLLWRAHRHGHASQNGRLGNALRAAVHVGGVLLGVALVANAFGNVSLAETLTGGVIDSLYFALLLAAGMTVLATWVQLLLKRPGVARFRLAREHAGPAVQRLLKLLTAAAVVSWIVYALDRFRVLTPVDDSLSALLGHSWALGDLRVSLGHVLLFALSVVIAFWLAKTVRLVLDGEVLSRLSLPHGVANSIASLSYYAVLMLGLIGALSAAGFKTSQLTLVLGALGVGIGLGLQNVVNNFVSGLVLIFERPFQPGDVVEVGGTTGRVRDIGMRATRLSTFDGASVVVPNGQMISQQLVNWTLFDRNRRLEVRVAVAYGNAPTEVEALLIDVARTTEGVAATPVPIVLFDSMGNVAMEFIVRAWTLEYDNAGAIRSTLVGRIYETLTARGIGLAHAAAEVYPPPSRTTL
ncbi:mechanosensitive ion channel domain-containing protein [Xanthomonas sp. 4461]|uniref:mechanosensitive ion channel domain-containing protein n=1 Tax=Xanthomonas sp. 4461 TaxID=3035313 RepID=UPI0021671A38|nr:mechanosensitive ion channel domain-containing protein [Xanthomonas sp. 4461]MCS3807508.1 small-conductance mechanosensitive channel [Xanthomonas sp. 4461]